MASPGDLKRGLIIELDGAPCVVEKLEIQTPSARGGNQLWKIRARNLKTKGKVDKVFRSGDSIVEPHFEKRQVQYLYGDGTHHHFMDLQDYDQFPLSQEMLEDESQYLIENMEGISALIFEEEVIGIELPLVLDLKITECDPTVKGNSATGRTKRAVLESGLVLQVPEHLDQGDTIRVDTTTGKFISRVSKG